MTDLWTDPPRLVATESPRLVPMEAPRLVVIRGNSGSGKSTLAKAVRAASPRRTALVEQDYLRRTVLMEKEREGGDNIDLIFQPSVFALDRGYDVILEGIFVFSRYGGMLRELVGGCPRHHVYYLDVPFGETLRRHATRPDAHEFGEAQMRDWYRERDLTGFTGERVFTADYSLERSVGVILSDLLTGARVSRL